MKTPNLFSTNLSLHNLFEELKTDLEQKPNYKTEDDVLHEFKSNTASEIGMIRDIENFGIYLTFSPSPTDGTNQFFSELFSLWPTFIPILQNYLESLFSENTNNYACSFTIHFDTNHGNHTIDENYWEIRIFITDYLS